MSNTMKLNNKKYIDIKHFIIRLLILAVVCVGIIFAMYLSTPQTRFDYDGNPHYGGNPALGAFILIVLASIIAATWFAIEAIALHKRGKKEKRNSNLLLLLLIGLGWLILFIK